MEETGYIFDLHLVCGGYTYFSTITRWVATSERGREIRAPSTVRVKVFESELSHLNACASQVDSQQAFDRWTVHRGWAFVPEVIARGQMGQWLSKRECIKDALNTYTDIFIAAPGALTHIGSEGRRRGVFERDGGRCLLCNATEEDGVRLTLHHVRAQSRAGETTSRNMICLCERCNQSLGSEQYVALYELAGVPHSLDIGLIKGETTGRALAAAMRISDNLMHTRCELYSAAAPDSFDRSPRRHQFFRRLEQLDDLRQGHGGGGAVDDSVVGAEA